MALNKLANFIKNTDGRTIYVNPADLNATDSISNQGTSLTEPFRSLQRALLEAARFSYVRGKDNDLIERTTIVLYPGEHTIDNRPGYGVKIDEDGNPVSVKQDGSTEDPFVSFNLKEDSNFDVNSTNNIIHRFNSIYGGVVIPRGTSIVGMDLRKTRIRPLYVPNPTDPAVPDSAIFRITGTCYFWQFTIFDGLETETVYTDPTDFSEANRAAPTFSHHKLTAFEYADGANPALSAGYELSDLAMYYSKLSNAYNEASGRAIADKFPENTEGFAPRRPEFEIVGSFATDPVNIVRIISGDGSTPDPVITVETATPHELNVGTPIKIRGVAVNDYNISTKVANIVDDQTFTYSLSFVRPNLPATPSVSSATVTVETDTVSGASPYIFNCSMRSVWGINGMHADGAKATGFRSMVVAQFTAISLQKDDRAFVRYNQETRKYDGINYPIVRGPALASQASSTNTAQVYHLDPQAVYRPGWDTTHIKMSNDAVIQIVSVFAIGFNQHFGALSGADASITNSNSNFGQFGLLADGFKNDAFDKDDQGFITSIITPNNAFNPETDRTEEVDFVNIDFDLTRSVAAGNQLYLLGYTNKEDLPPATTQGFRIGANYDETLYLPTSTGSDPVTAKVQMIDNLIDITNSTSVGTSIGRKVYPVEGAVINSLLTITNHGLQQGEKIRIFSGTGELPENVEKATQYFCNVIDANTIRLATSVANAFNNIFVNIIGGVDLRIESRVNDKSSGDPGHPIQYNDAVQNWFIHTNNNSEIYQYIVNGDGRVGSPGENDGQDFVSYFNRNPDSRNLNDKVYRLRYVLPKESINAKPPTPGYVIQQSSTTGPRNDDDFTLDSITIEDYGYERNNRFIVSCEVDGDVVRVRAERPHTLSLGDKVKIINVSSTNNPTASPIRGYNGEFMVTAVRDARNFDYSLTDVDGFLRDPGDFTNDVNVRDTTLPRFERKDNSINAFAYRVEEITSYVEGIRDGIYHLFCVNSSNRVNDTFTDRQYTQPIEDFYPQMDLDNLRQNPPSSTTYAAKAPLGRTFLDDLQNSLTRETIDKIYKSNNVGIITGSELVSDLGFGAQTRNIYFERGHNFDGIYNWTTLNGSSGYIDGTYHNVSLVSAAGTFKGASATVSVSGGTVDNVQIKDPGAGYVAGEELFLSTEDLPGGSASIIVGASDIEFGSGDVLQFTGGGAVYPDFYGVLIATDPNDPKKLTIRCSDDDLIVEGMYVYPTDSSTPVTYSYDSATGQSTFSASFDYGIGLQRGNSFIVFDVNRKAIGKFYVKGLPTPTVMEAITNVELSNVAFIGKCGLEDNDAPTGSIGENIGVRGTELFGLGTFYLEQPARSEDVEIVVRGQINGANASIREKMYLGRYLKIGSEIMRVASYVDNGNIIEVIRGALGTDIARHETNEKIRAIEPQAIELRRPSILRASAHTFEYLGYGPGNYSTSLPQLQIRQLPDDETYLVQSQELSCGQVVYTGMSDNGDFYIGNTKYSSASGKQTTFDVPIPTIAGQEASTNSVVFDEMIVNRRLFVAGGETNEVLSQFDGPVKFTQNVTIQGRMAVISESSLFTTIINDTQNSVDEFTGSLTIRGGVGINKDLFVGGKLDVPTLTIEGTMDVGGDASMGGFVDIVGGLGVGGDIILENVDDFTLSNRYKAVNGNQPMSLFNNQVSADIEIGTTGTTRDVRFRTTQPGIGEGGLEEANTSTAGVVADGGVVVRDVVIAKEFKGDGLGPGVGNMVMWAGPSNTFPRNYLYCDGRSLNRFTYSKLFAVIGYTYGGSGNNFRIPDLRNQFIVGSGNAYSTGNRGGEAFVSLTVDEIAKHTHVSDTQSTTHAHPGSTASTGPSTVPHGHGSSVTPGGGTHFHDAVDTSPSEGAHFHPEGNAGGASHLHPISLGSSTDAEHPHSSSSISPGGGTHDHPESSAGATQDKPGTHSHAQKVATDFVPEPKEENPNQVEAGARTAFWFQNKDVTLPGKGRHSHDINVPSRDSTHTHGLSVPGGEHSHPITFPTAGSHEHPSATFPSAGSSHSHTISTPNGTSGHEHTMTTDPSNAGTHKHTASVTVANYAGGHIHKIDNTGSSSGHENRPPYFALSYLIQYK